MGSIPISSTENTGEFVARHAATRCGEPSQRLSEALAPQMATRPAEYMKLAAADAIAASVNDEDLCETFIMPPCSRGRCHNELS